MRVASEVAGGKPSCRIWACTLGLRVLELFTMYATDGQTDVRTDGRRKAKLTAPFRTGGTIINIQIDRALAAYCINSKFLGGRKHMGYRWWRLLPEAQISVCDRIGDLFSRGGNHSDTLVCDRYATAVAATRKRQPLQASTKFTGDSFLSPGGNSFHGQETFVTLFVGAAARQI